MFVCFRVLKKRGMDEEGLCNVGNNEEEEEEDEGLIFRIGLKQKLGGLNLNHSHSLIATMRNCSLGWSVTNLSIHCVLHRLLLLSTQIWLFFL